MAVRLKMNNSKTAFIYFGGPKQVEKCIINQINVNGEQIPRTQMMRYLGAYLDPALNLKQHIKMKCRAAMLNLLKIKATRKYLTTEACTKAVITLVMTHLDYLRPASINYKECRLWHQKSYYRETNLIAQQNA